MSFSASIPIMPFVLGDSTIYIHADGSIDPPTANITRVGDLYTFTADIFTDSGIVIERNNMTLDGTGHVLKGSSLSESKGISMSYRINVTIMRMEIHDFGYGIWFTRSTNNTIVDNRIVNNSDYGIYFGYVSTHNMVASNYIDRSNYGIFLWLSSDNIIYHNVFDDNTIQAGITFSPLNTWDDGSVSGGNYWRDFAAKYPNATEIGSSGIWDTAYTIDVGNVDRYPTVNPSIVPEYASILIAIVLMFTSLPTALLWKNRFHNKCSRLTNVKR